MKDKPAIERQRELQRQQEDRREARQKLEGAQETRRCVEAEGRRCLLIAGDVSQSAFCQDAVQRTVQAYGKLDILVNNAAFQLHAASLEDISDEQFDETVMCSWPLRCARATSQASCCR